MLVRYKLIEHGVLGDAPFVGSRISGISCSNNCEGCCNQHLLYAPIKTAESYQVIDEVLEHPISAGVIFGGLEWSEQPEELLELVTLALQNGLEVMIYSHLDLIPFLRKFPSLFEKKIYVKCGPYKQDYPTFMDKKNDVLLASSNQHIFRLDKI